jgi:hypothetical protein
VSQWDWATPEERSGDPLRETFTPYSAVAIVEGREEADEERVLAAWQYLVDTRIVWSLQGSLQRQAVALVEQGIINGPSV